MDFDLSKIKDFDCNEKINISTPKTLKNEKEKPQNDPSKRGFLYEDIIKDVFLENKKKQNK